VLDRIWYRSNLLCWLLWPLSQVYKFIVFVKAFLYKHNFFNIEYFDVPVIVVGNITVGGTGKTPFCIALCDYLQQQGLSPGLVSRGYGGRAKSWPQVVSADSDPLMVGDEPILLVERTGCPMVVGPDRAAAVKRLLNEFGCDIVISDDGLQHYGMGRDIEIVIIDHSRGLGNGLCLPAGPLRESDSRLKKVDFVIKNGSSQMQISSGEPYAINDGSCKLKVSNTVNKSVCAMAAIGNPKRFFDSLEAQGFEFQTKVFRDHHYYTREDLQDIDADIIIMTEKDAVKCRRFNDDRCYVLPIDASVSTDLLGAMLAAVRKKSKQASYGFEL
jgi:tetraacyldisaccharide 4'-kinase